ncbi:MAG: GHKL domain-containing protein [Acidobacteria bacterium]|nr:GHKL domain-containing protein [Acidobacteriota bacterium]
MRASQWFRPSRHLLALFLSVAFVLAAALGWLTWRLLEQDRALESQRIQERMDSAADLITAGLQRSLSETDEQLKQLSVLPDSQLNVTASEYGKHLAPGALIVVFRPRNIEAYPQNRLVYYPFLPAPKASADVFAAGEALEFQQRDHAKAITVFREQAGSKDPQIRAGALLRLGRNLRKAGQARAALGVYNELANLRSTFVEGLPAELLARHARCALFEELKQLPELRREAHALWLDLYSGRWSLTSGSFHFYVEETRRWLNFPAKLSPEEQSRELDALVLAAGAESLWDEWERSRRDSGNLVTQRTARLYDRPVLLLSRSTAERVVALVVGPLYLQQQWLAALQPITERQRVRVVLADAEGRPVLGQTAAAAPQQALRTTAETQLPWMVHVTSADPRADLAELTKRRHFLLAGLGVMALLVLVGIYFIARAASRELEVVRLESEFVSAVSHEFRTPLASLRQLSELLVDGRVPSEQRRQEYYEALRRESERLHRLVEALLDFGRMEAGAREYRFELLDAGSLLRGVVEEFEQEVAERGYHVEAEISQPFPQLQADREALSRALWNLLDNAVKYSPTCKSVRLEATSQDNQVVIRIRDQGLGIAPNEETQIFNKFFRGVSAHAAGAKGTGLGLAMVRHIIAAHGGEVRVESQPGAGSTFTVLLPTARE